MRIIFMPVLDGLDTLLNCLRPTLFGQVNLVPFSSLGFSLVVNDYIALLVLFDGVLNALNLDGL